MRATEPQPTEGANWEVHWSRPVLVDFPGCDGQVESHVVTLNYHERNGYTADYHGTNKELANWLNAMWEMHALDILDDETHGA